MEDTSSLLSDPDKKKDGGKKKVQVKVVLPQVAADPSDDVEVKGHHQQQVKLSSWSLCYEVTKL
jgi:hypothetical protein